MIDNRPKQERGWDVYESKTIVLLAIYKLTFKVAWLENMYFEVMVHP